MTTRLPGMSDVPYVTRNPLSWPIRSISGRPTPKTDRSVGEKSIFSSSFLRLRAVGLGEVMADPKGVRPNTSTGMGEDKGSIRVAAPAAAALAAAVS